MFFGKRIPFLAVSVFIFLIAAPLYIHAQCFPTLAHDSLQLVTDAPVYCSETKGDTMYVGGQFNYIGKYTGGMAQVDASGKLTMPGNWPRVHGSVYAMEPDGNGGYYIGGIFNKIGDSTRLNLAHINKSGVVTSFKIQIRHGSLKHVIINAILKKNDKLYIGGSFEFVGEARRRNIACININTFTVTDWGLNIDGNVNAMVMHHDTIYIAGAFTKLGFAGDDAKYLVAVDTLSGQIPLWNADADAEVKDICIDNGYLYASGKFGVIGGQSRTGVASFNLSNRSITSWSPVVTMTSTTSINSISVLGGRVYIGGNFTTVDNKARQNAASVDRYTGAANNWNPAPDSEVHSIRVNDNKIYLGGRFKVVSSDKRIGLAALDSLGTLQAWSPHSRAIDSKGVTNFEFYNSATFVMGEINSVGGVLRTGLAAFNAKTSEILLFSPAVGGTGNRSINALKRKDNILYIGGAFNSLNGLNRQNIAAYNISTASITSLALSGMTGGSNEIKTIELSGSKLYIGGSFSKIFGQTRNNACAVDNSSGALQNWAPNPNGTVHVIKEKGNSIFIGGTFSTAAGQSRKNAAVISTAGSLQSWSPSTTPDKVYDIDFIGNAVYISGDTVVKVDTITSSSNPAMLTWNVVPVGKEVHSLLPYNNKVYVAGNNKYIDGGVDTSANASAAGMRLDHGGVIYNLNTVDSTLYAFGSIDSINHSEKMLTGIVRTEISMIPKHASAKIVSPSTVCTYSVGGQERLWEVTTNMQNPTYEWYRNGSMNKTTTESITDVYGSTGDKIHCVIKPGMGCYAQQAVHSDTIQVVRRTLNVSIDDSKGPIVICSDLPSKYEIVTVGDTFSKYYWYFNGRYLDSIHDNPMSFIPNATGTLLAYAQVKDTGCYSTEIIYLRANRITAVVQSIVPGSGFYPANFFTSCVGDSVELTLVSNMHFGTHNWSINGVGVGNTTKKLIIPNLNLNDTVKCIITADTPNCFTSQVITDSMITGPRTNINPTVTLAGVPAAICKGDTLTVTASTNFPVKKYFWYVNGSMVSSTTTPDYIYVPATGIDVVTCAAFPKSGCYDPDSALSSGVTVKINPPAIPNIFISGPATAGLFAPVQLTANIANAGSNYAIEWKKNGVTFATTTTNSTSYIKGAGSDNIQATITPVGCYIAETSAVFIVAEAVAIKNIQEWSGIEIYPNPTSGVVYISGMEYGDKIQVFDVLSRLVQTGMHSEKAGGAHTLDLQELNKGIYLLEISNASGVKKSTHKLNKY